jgi:hypothetical protein
MLRPYRGNDYGSAMRPIFALAALALAGCADSTGVMPLGGNRYIVTTQTDYMSGGMANAQRMAIRDAAAFCAGRGERVETDTTSRGIDQRWGYYDFTLQFQCAPNAPQAAGR